MSAGDELLSLMKMGAQQALGDQRAHLKGHISTYDPDLHRCRVIFPGLRNEDGTPALSPWMPLATMWAGNGFGFQVAPFGGSTFANPTAGEPCGVDIIQRGQGVFACAYLNFNQVVVPPGGLLAGEAILKDPNGSFLKFDQTGDVTLITARDLNATTGRDLNAAVGRNLNATVTGSLTATITGAAQIVSSTMVQVFAPVIQLGKQAGDTLHALVTSLFFLVYNGHTHPISGGNTGVPNQQAGTSQETSIVTAE